MKNQTKENVNNLIFEMAYEIETKLSNDNYFLAGIAGVKPEEVSDIALQCAIRKLKQIME